MPAHRPIGCTFPRMSVGVFRAGKRLNKQKKTTHVNDTHTNKLKQQQPHNLSRNTVECVYTVLHVEVLVQIQYYFTLLCRMFQ